MIEEEFDDISFLDQDKLKKQEDKIESGEITLTQPRFTRGLRKLSDNVGS